MTPLTPTGQTPWKCEECEQVRGVYVEDVTQWARFQGPFAYAKEPSLLYREEGKKKQKQKQKTKNKTKQNKTKQNKTKNKTKQNKNKQHASKRLWNEQWDGRGEAKGWNGKIRPWDEAWPCFGPLLYRLWYIVWCEFRDVAVWESQFSASSN